jgi:hypothetical protein
MATRSQTYRFMSTIMEHLKQEYAVRPTAVFREAELFEKNGVTHIRATFQVAEHAQPYTVTLTMAISSVDWEVMPRRSEIPWISEAAKKAHSRRKGEQDYSLKQQEPGDE